MVKVGELLEEWIKCCFGSWYSGSIIIHYDINIVDMEIFCFQSWSISIAISDSIALEDLSKFLPQSRSFLLSSLAHDIHFLHRTAYEITFPVVRPIMLACPEKLA